MIALRTVQKINKNGTRLYTTYKRGGIVPLHSLECTKTMGLKAIQSDFNKYNAGIGVIMSVTTI